MLSVLKIAFEAQHALMCSERAVDDLLRIGRAHQGLGGLSPPNFFPHLWMCIESKLLKKYKKIVESTHQVIILIFV